MRAIADPDEGPIVFAFDGSEFESLDAVAMMPVESMKALEIAIRALVPNDSLSPASVTYSPKTESVNAGVVLPEFNRTNPKLSEQWPQVLQIAQLILEQGYPHASLRVVSSQSSVVHFGGCVNRASTDSAGADDALWAAISSSGLALPEGSGAGECLD